MEQLIPLYNNEILEVTQNLKTYLEATFDFVYNHNDFFIDSKSPLLNVPNHRLIFYLFSLTNLFLFQNKLYEHLHSTFCDVMVTLNICPLLYPYLETLYLSKNL